MNDKLLKRIKSFLWRALMLGIVASLEWILSNLGLLDLPVWITGILGLILGEISKHINNCHQNKEYPNPMPPLPDIH